MANSGLISKVHLQEMWGPSFIQAWELLELRVKHKRLNNHEQVELKKGAFSRKDFETFVAEINHN